MATTNSPIWLPVYRSRRPRTGIRFVVVLVGFFVAVAPGRADASPITHNANITFTVPDPNNPSSCIEVDYGVMAFKGDVDPTRMITVAGFQKTYTGDDCCDSLHFLNIVTADPNPPKWKDANDGVFQIPPGHVYIDPLSGGNIPPGKDTPQPRADRNPWYDGEQPNQRASTTGDFKDGEQKQFDLNDMPAWTNDPLLTLVFADVPTLTEGLQFFTLLVCVNGNQLCPIAGFSWGVDADGEFRMEGFFSGTDYPAGLNTSKIQGALNISGFGGYTLAAGTPCCPVPEPTTFCLLGTGIVAAFGRRRRPVM
jgi:hypothetical protein